jgi:Domain of unknown function (DUF5122) beta-propeller
MKLCNFLSLHTLAIFLAIFANSVVAAPGELDPTFGFVATPYRPLGVVSGWPAPVFTAETVYTAAFAVRKDGTSIRLVPCLSATTLNQSMCVNALTDAGNYFNTFGTGNGVVDLLQSGDTQPFALALDRDENSWVAGRCSGQSCLLKLSRNGLLANNLGTSANLNKVTIASMIDATTIDVTFDDKLIVGGRCSSGGSSFPCAMRMNANGTPDTTFNGGNALLWGNNPDFQSEQLTGGKVLKIKARADGRAYAGGSCMPLFSGTRPYMCVALIEANGSLNPIYTIYPEGGYDVSSYYIVGVPQSSNDEFSDMQVQVDGGAILLGTCKYVLPLQTTFSACLTRVHSGIGVDPYFGFNGYLKPFLTGDNHPAAGLLLREDGAMIVIANCDIAISGGAMRRRLCLSALAPTGTYSLQFAGNATAYAQIELDPTTVAGTLRLKWEGIGASRYNDNSFIAYGGCRSETGFRSSCVARISLESRTGPRCSPDMDGNKISAANTDGLLLMRALRGLTDVAVTANAVGNNATRNSESTIRSFLVDQCGMQ